MINKDRIVPVNNTDLLTLYALIIGISEDQPLNFLPVGTDSGADFPESGDEDAIYFCTEPVKVVRANMGEGEQPSWALEFIPAYDFEGIVVEVDGMKTVITEAVAYGSSGQKKVPIKKDATSLYVMRAGNAGFVVREITPAYYED